MGKNYPILWTDHTFNPWIGCTCVSPGCDHCCAESESRSRGWAEWGAGQPRQKTSKTTWSHPFKWNAEAMKERRRRRVLCADLADVFDDEADPEWREELWALIRQTPYLDWVLLTRRPENIASMLPTGWGEGWPNVCLMASVENQEQTGRIPLLLAAPARYRAIAFEPLLSPVKLQRKWLKAIHWIVIGGEHGAGARPMHPDWVRAIRKQCESAKIRFHFKQWGNWVPDLKFAKTDGSNIVCFPTGSNEAIPFEALETEENRAMSATECGTFMFRTEKHVARKLDGFIHRGHPFPRSIPEREIVLPLTAEERHRLQACEKTIREGLATFVAVGNALMEIRTAKLYRQGYPTFEAYVQGVLALTRPRAYQLIDSAEVMRDLSTIVDISELPQNEGQVRELGRWKTAEERVEKWKTVLAAAGEQQPVTAKFIRQTLCPPPGEKADAIGDAKAQVAASCLARLRHLVSNSPAEAKVSKLIAKLEEALAEAEAQPAAAPTAQPDLWLPGFL